MARAGASHFYKWANYFGRECFNMKRQKFPRHGRWCSRYLRGAGYDCLVLVINPDRGVDELWARATPWYPLPRDWRELDHWLYDPGQVRWGYRRLTELRGRKGEPADPGPWLLQLLHDYDLARDPKALEKYWAKIVAAERKAEGKKADEAREIAKPYARGMYRELIEGKSPHGGLVQVPK
jgi:hypothetical protein